MTQLIRVSSSVFSDGRHAENLDTRRSVLQHDRRRRRRRASGAQVDGVGVERDVVRVRLVGGLAEQWLHVVSGRHAGVGRRRAAAANRAVGRRRAALTTLLTGAAAAAEAAATANAQLGDVATERRRRGKEKKRARGEEGVVKEVDDGAGKKHRRAVGNRALSGEARVGHEQERVEREARQQ